MNIGIEGVDCYVVAGDDPNVELWEIDEPKLKISLTAPTKSARSWQSERATISLDRQLIINNHPIYLNSIHAGNRQDTMYYCVNYSEGDVTHVLYSMTRKEAEVIALKLIGEGRDDIGLFELPTARDAIAHLTLAKRS